MSFVPGPRIDRSITLNFYGDWGQANLHRVFCWLSQEMVDLLRRTLERETDFKILTVEPPNLPEQTVEDLLKNVEFWRSIGRRYGADLILSGEVLFDIENRSGFVAEDYISPVTGQRVRRTRYAEQEAFDLSLQVFFFSGETGELSYRDRFGDHPEFPRD